MIKKTLFFLTETSKDRNYPSTKGLIRNQTIVSRFFCCFLMLFIVVNISAQKKFPYAPEKPVSKEVHALFLKAIQANDTTKMELLLQNDAIVYSNNSSGGRWSYYGIPYDDPLLTAIETDAQAALRMLIKKDRRTLLTRYGQNGKGEILILSPLVYALQKRKAGCYFILDKAIYDEVEGDARLNKDIKEQALSCGNDLFNIVMGRSAKYITLWMPILQKRGYKLSPEILNEKLATSVSDTISAKIFLDLGANPNYIHTGTTTRSWEVAPLYNVLISAVANKNYDLAKYLIERGANVNVKTTWSPLLIAVQEPNNLDFVTYLIKKGANVNFVGGSPNPNVIMGSRKYSVLQSAKEEYKEILILNGAR